MENTCLHCRVEYSRPPSLIGRFCSKACGYAHRRKAEPAHRRIRYLPEHPLAGPTGLVSEARAVLYERIGPEPHACHWCGVLVEWQVGERGNITGALIADHVDDNPLNDAPSNIVPACGRCNGNRTQSIKTGEAFLVRPNGTRVRAVERTCQHCSAVFLVPPAALNRPNKGHFCSRSCARSGPRAK